jgi:hypothetical protein
MIAALRQRIRHLSAVAQGARRPHPFGWAAIALTAVVAVAGSHAAQGQSAATFTPRDESPENFPPGPGRDETFYACTACHGFKLVAQQGMNRRQWDESLTWMTEKHGMPKLEGDDRRIVLDYLETTYPPSTSSGSGYQNPFLNR